MASSWIKKVKSKIKARPQTPPPETALSSPVSIDTKTSLPSLQERLWNQAYDELKASEHRVVDTYETILSAGLNLNDSAAAGLGSTKNEIGKTPDTRCQQMQQLVQAELDRRRKEASIKKGKRSQ
jgi:hypothetical protein